MASALGLTSAQRGLASDEPTARTIPDGVDGLPGLYRIGIPGTAAPRGGAGLWMNYGYTEPQNGEADPHHRLGGTFAAGGALLPYVAAALRVDFRHDLHGDDAMGPDSGSALDVSPILRAGYAVNRSLHLGVEGRLVFGGHALSPGLADPIFDGRLLASFLGPSGWTVAGLGGLRTGSGDLSAANGGMLRPGDRVALGVSEFPALLVGLGVAKEWGGTSLLLEGTWDVLVADGAPPVAESPLRIAAGVRRMLLPGLYLHGLLEVAPAARAPSLPGDPLVPVEPRFSAILGVSLRLPELLAGSPPPLPAPLDPAAEQQAEPPESAPPEPPPEAPTATLEIRVVDETGHPISDALVTVTVPASGELAEEQVVVPLREVNLYVIEGLPLGPVEVSVEADLLQTHSEHVGIEEGEPTELTVALRKAGGLGSQLRGLVRSYSGQGIPAQVSVSPGNYSATCNDDGEFVLDVPPGHYTVTIEAAGYAAQKRQLRVRKESVTVLNADLRND